MKNFTTWLVAIAGLFLYSPLLPSQTTTVATEPVSGLIQEIVPAKSILVRVPNEAQPRSFALTASTQFADTLGNAVTSEQFREGSPVTIQYVKQGADVVVNKVILMPVPAAEAGAAAQSPATVQSTTVTTVAPAVTPKVESAEGIITEFVPASASLVIDSPASSVPMKFLVDEQTEFLDTEGNAAARPSVDLGRAVTVHYQPSGTELLAVRVVVGKVERLVPVKTQ